MAGAALVLLGGGGAATYFSGPHDTITSRQYETGLSNNAQGHEEESGWDSSREAEKYRGIETGTKPARYRVLLAENERGSTECWGSFIRSALYIALYKSVPWAAGKEMQKNKNLCDANPVRNSGLQTWVRELSQEQKKDRKKKDKKAHLPQFYKYTASQWSYINPYCIPFESVLKF